MQKQTLQIDENLQETVIYQNHTIPLALCHDHFDDYYHNFWECHWHDEFELAVLVQGKLDYTIYGQPPQVLHLQAGDGIFINTNVIHSAQAQAPHTILNYLAIPPNFFNLESSQSLQNKYISPILNSSLRYLPINDDEIDQSLVAKINQICKLSADDFDYDLKSLELVCHIWRLISEKFRNLKINRPSVKSSSYADRTKTIVQYIHENYRQPLTIESIAKNVGISRTECFRCFKNSLGKTPNQYILAYRLSMAKTLLSESKYTLSDIAHKCGFQDPSYFGKCFRNNFGITPKQFRLNQ